MVAWPSKASPSVQLPVVVALPAGDHVQVTATGEAVDTAVIDAPLTLEAGVAYEVAATGLLATSPRR
jgi:hypothetical protein